MSCARLSVSSREAMEFDDLPPRERALALEHLETCVPCRRAALAADPSLVFSVGLAGRVPERPDAGEAERMRVSVEALRRTTGLRSGAPGAATRLRAAVAAVLVAAVLILSDGAGRTPIETVAVSPFAGILADSDLLESSAIEDLDRPLARVYQLKEKDLSLVMIVDETLDI